MDLSIRNRAVALHIDPALVYYVVWFAALTASVVTS
jgi:hypothetical protein